MGPKFPSRKRGSVCPSVPEVYTYKYLIQVVRNKRGKPWFRGGRGFIFLKRCFLQILKWYIYIYSIFNYAIISHKLGLGHQFCSFFFRLVFSWSVYLFFFSVFVFFEWIPWNSKTKQRMVFRMIHGSRIPDEKPMGQGLVGKKDFMHICFCKNIPWFQLLARWWFQIFLIFTRTLGRWSNLTKISSNGLKPPTSWDVSFQCGEVWRFEDVLKCRGHCKVGPE